MHSTLTLTLLTLLASALAAPAPISNKDKDIVNQDHVLYLPATNNGDNANALSARQERCDWEAYCLPAYQRCVRSCNSLNNSDCFDVVTSPSCQGCNVSLAGCSA